MTMRASTSLGHPLPRGLPNQQQREDRRRHVADSWNEPKDRIDAEGQACARHTKRAVEQHRRADGGFQSALVLIVVRRGIRKWLAHSGGTRT